MAACREALDDGSGAELRMDFSLRIEARGRVMALQLRLNYSW
jgi:hypothetical protein